MSSSLLIWVSFITAAVSAWALGSLIIDFFNSSNRIIRQRIRTIQNKHHLSQHHSLFNEQSELNSDSTADLRSYLGSRLLRLLEQSDSRMTVFLFLFLVLVSAVTIGTLATILRPSWISALLGSLAGGLLPYFWLFLQRQRRLTRLRDQLPEAFDLMRRAVQSGQTMQMSMQIVSKECSLPINREFARCCEQYSLGLPQEAILKELARRNDIMEFRIFVVAMLVQRMSGGNPVELLENLAQRVRKRKRLRDRVQAFTSEGRMQAFVLCVLPVAAFIAIYFLDKNYAQVLLDRPWLLGSLVMAQVVGTVWIRQIVHFDY